MSASADDTGTLDAADGPSGRLFQTALCCAVFLSLIPWFLVQIHQSINADNACLLIAAQRLLSGGTMTQDFNYPNPPLCILIYIPPVLLAKYAHIPVYHALFLYSLSLVALSTWAVCRVAGLTKIVGRNERALLLAGYVLCNTVLVGQFLGEREQYILLGLLPFILMQAAITQRMRLPRRLRAGVLVLGSIAALIKPHFCIVPAAILIHRMVTQRRCSVVFDEDGIALLATGALYALLLGIAFPDFADAILPDIVTLYLPVRKAAVMPVAVSVALFCLVLAFYALLLPGPTRKATAALFCVAALSIIPFWVQGRGYFYHTIPTMAFLGCGLLLLAHQALVPAVRKIWPAAEPALPLAIFAAFAAITYGYMPPNAAYPTHDDYRRSEFATVVNDCGKPCPFFMFNDTSEIIYPLTVYTSQTYASRFPAYWFLPPIVRAQYALDHSRPSALSRNNVAALRKKYAAMVVADFRRYDPDLLMIGQFNIVGEDKHPFDYAAWFSSDPEFLPLWNRYRLVRDMDVDMNAYFGGTMYAGKPNIVRYKIYRRIRTG